MKYLKHLAAAVLAIAATAVQAAPITINSITAQWRDAAGAPVVYSGNGTQTATVAWGGSVPQSAYIFEASGVPLLADTDGPKFDLGRFVHNNFPILPPAITGVTLDVFYSVFGAGNYTATYRFNHIETTNAPPCQFPGGDPCADEVTLVNATAPDQFFTIDGVDYVLEILGFKGSPGLKFVTFEGQANASLLEARVTTRTVPEPLPLALLGVGLIAAGVASRKRKPAPAAQ